MKKAILLIGVLGLVAAGCNFRSTTNSNPPAQQGNNSSENTSKPATQDDAVQDSQHVSDARRFTSNDLGVTFTYLAQPGGPKPDSTVQVTEKNNGIYVHFSDQAPEQGQFMLVFQKDSSQDLKTAIEQQFLKGILSTQCFVKTDSLGAGDKNPSHVFAEISYPVNPNTQGPAAIPAPCPAAYSQTNGLRYFMMDKNHPDRFFFFSIGQYSLTSDGTLDKPNNPAPNWSNSVEVLAK